MNDNSITPEGDKTAGLESRREFIKVATAATALAAGAATLSAQSSKQAVSVLGGKVEQGYGWVPSAVPPDMSSHSNLKSLLLGPVPPTDNRELPANELIPHHLRTLATAQNVSTESIQTMDEAALATLEFGVVESHQRMQRVFDYIVNQVSYLIAQLNQGVVAASAGQGPAAYDRARESYLAFVESKGGYDQALASLTVNPVYTVQTQKGQTGIVVGVEVVARWRNPHISSSGIPINHG